MPRPQKKKERKKKKVIGVRETIFLFLILGNVGLYVLWREFHVGNATAPQFDLLKAWPLKKKGFTHLISV